MPTEQDAAPDAEPDRRTLLLAAIAGMAAIVALPLSVTAAWLVAPLIFSVPLLLALSGKLRAQPMLIGIAAGLLVLLGATFLLNVEVLGLAAVVVLLAGPILAVLLVGPPLRDLDQIAAGAFLLGGTIAVVAGFTTAGISRQGSAIVVGVVAVVSLTVVSSRLARTP